METQPKASSQLEAPLKLKLAGDLKVSLRKGEKVRVSVIRLALSALNYAEIAKQSTLTDSDVMGVIAREIRQRQESIEAFRKGNRQDLVDKESAEVAVLQDYLPRQLSREEIAAEARRIIAEVGARGPADKSKVMPRIIAQLKGKADGREINNVVTELLSSP